MTDNSQDPTERIIEPCEHMTNAVNGLADGSLRGPMKFYTKLHTLHCRKCRTALNSLTILHTRLGALAISDEAITGEGLTPQRHGEMLNTLDEIERTKTESLQ